MCITVTEIKYNDLATCFGTAILKAHHNIFQLKQKNWIINDHVQCPQFLTTSVPNFLTTIIILNCIKLLGYFPLTNMPVAELKGSMLLKPQPQQLKFGLIPHCC